jgi:hypothetical protein
MALTNVLLLLGLKKRQRRVQYGFGSEVKSKRGTTSDLERALVFEQYEYPQNNKGKGSLKMVKKAEPLMTRKLAMTKLSHSSCKCFYRDYKKWECDKSSIYLTSVNSQATPNAQPTTRDHQLKT